MYVHTQKHTHIHGQMYTHAHVYACTRTLTHMHAHTQTCENTGNPLAAGNKHLYQCVPIQHVGLHSNHDTTNISHTNNTTPQHNMITCTSGVDLLRSRNFFSGATIPGLLLAVG